MEPNQVGTGEAVAASPDVFQEIGSMTRQVHDGLKKLGLMPKLLAAADGLPDARSRLVYITTKTAEAAMKVLDSVDAARVEQNAVASRTAQLVDEMTNAHSSDSALSAVARFTADMDQHASRMDELLTNIMLAQDFQDLTGQVVASVIALAQGIEDDLVNLLLSLAERDPRGQSQPADLAGPVIDSEVRQDVVHSQGEVDDLLASLGF